MWDPTPSHTPAGAATPGRDTPGHATPGHGGATGSVRKNRWDETPKTERETPGHGSGWAETPRTDRGDESVEETPTPGASKRKSRWDETPASQMGSSTPLLTPGKTPIGTPAMNMATPTPGKYSFIFTCPVIWYINGNCPYFKNNKYISLLILFISCTQL